MLNLNSLNFFSYEAFLYKADNFLLADYRKHYVFLKDFERIKIFCRTFHCFFKLYRRLASRVVISYADYSMENSKGTYFLWMAPFPGHFIVRLYGFIHLKPVVFPMVSFDAFSDYDISRKLNEAIRYVFSHYVPPLLDSIEVDHFIYRKVNAKHET